MIPIGHGRHVHFADKDILHYPSVIPSIFPPTFLSSTNPSSLGMITPPSAFYPLYDPSTSHYSEFPCPHPYLEISGISWDMTNHPSTISRHHQSILGRTWKEPATTPPLPFITIKISNFPWKFTICASNRSYVTFKDVVQKIYRSLRKNVTEYEFYAVASVIDRQRAWHAYEQRYRQQSRTWLYEQEKRGIKRVDFLMGCTQFGGLVNTSRRADEWNLNITGCGSCPPRLPNTHVQGLTSIPHT